MFVLIVVGEQGVDVVTAPTGHARWGVLQGGRITLGSQLRGVGPDHVGHLVN